MSDNEFPVCIHVGSGKHLCRGCAERMLREKNDAIRDLTKRAEEAREAVHAAEAKCSVALTLIRLVKALDPPKCTIPALNFAEETMPARAQAVAEFIEAVERQRHYCSDFPMFGVAVADEFAKYQTKLAALDGQGKDKSNVPMGSDRSGDHADAQEAPGEGTPRS